MTLPDSSKIVITGGSGFIGSNLLKVKPFHNSLAIGRTPPKKHAYFQKISLLEDPNLKEVFIGKDIVVHLAARAHVMKDRTDDPLKVYRNINTNSTLNLAKQAALSGVKRFIFVSTIKVLGETPYLGKDFKFDDPLNPKDPYSISKAEAEEGLKSIGESYGMEIVIIRPPLVYGQGVKGNFKNLMKLIKLKIPLPFRSLNNKRSFVSVTNLIDLIITCLGHPKAKNQTFLVSDDDDLSTPKLISMLADITGEKVFLFNFPKVLIYLSLRVIGKLAIYNRLCGSMCADIEHTKSLLGWSPPQKVKDALKESWL